MSFSLQHAISSLTDRQKDPFMSRFPKYRILDRVLRPRYVAAALLATLLNTFGPTSISLIILNGYTVPGPGPLTALADPPDLGDVQQSLDVNQLLNLPDVPASTGLDADGYPIGAGRGYTPAQENPLLGKSLILTPMECAKKYGIQFCACTKLDDGRDACYHQTPSAGYYDLATCEAIWGSGQCVCKEDGACYYPGQEREAKGMSCLDQIFFFPGESMECRKAGLMTVGNNCCKTSDEASSSCGFENLASKLGISDILMTALSVGSTINDLTGFTTSVGLTGNTVVGYAAEALAEKIVESWIANGTTTGLIADLTMLVGDAGAEVAITTLETGLATAGETIAADAATAAVAGMLSSMITIVSIAYTLYQIYNIVQQLAECTPGELMLGCKRAKHVCHKVGNRCKIKIFGMCLQDMEVFCCFNTQLARIIHEQGRPQIGLDWGSGKSPRCRGFYADEFVSLDFGRMDFGEYATELTKQMSSDIGPKVEQAVQKAMDNFGVQ
jgi:hypothetical protein